MEKINKKKRRILVNFYAGVNPEDYGVCKSRINYKPECIRDLGCEYTSIQEVSDEIGISLTTIKDALKRTFEKNNTKTNISKTAFEIALKQLI